MSKYSENEIGTEKMTYALLVTYDEDLSSAESVALSCLLGAFLGGHLLTSLIILYECIFSNAYSLASSAWPMIILMVELLMICLIGFSKVLAKFFAYKSLFVWFRVKFALYIQCLLGILLLLLFFTGLCQSLSVTDLLKTTRNEVAKPSKGAYLQGTEGIKEDKDNLYLFLLWLTKTLSFQTYKIEVFNPILAFLILALLKIALIKIENTIFWLINVSGSLVALILLRPVLSGAIRPEFILLPLLALILANMLLTSDMILGDPVPSQSGKVKQERSFGKIPVFELFAKIACVLANFLFILAVLFLYTVLQSSTTNYQVWKLHTYEGVFVVFMLVIMGCGLWVLGCSYELGQLLLRLLYPNIPRTYPNIPLLDGPNVRRGREAGSLSCSEDSFFED